MPAVIGSNLAARISGFAQGKALEKRATKGARNTRPFYDFIQSRKKSTQFTGDEVLVPIKEPAYNLNAQKWSGTDALNNPVGLNPGMLASFQSSNMFWPIQWSHDELRKVCGITILPNDNTGHGGKADGRIAARDMAGERILYDKFTEDIESAMDRAEENCDLELHRQGATVKDLAGMNAIMPLSLTGNFGGLSRRDIPALQHVVFAGPGTTSAPAGGNIGATGAVTGSTLLPRMNQFLRRLKINAATCGLSGGKFRLFAGSKALDNIAAAYRAAGLQWQADAASQRRVNLILNDEKLGIGDYDVTLDPTLDIMDIVAASEQGVGVSQLTVTFSGGGATRQATGVAMLTAAGAVSAIVITDYGEGYTSAPSVAIGNVGGGTGATFQALVYSASSGAGLTQVASDDVRIGRLASVTVTAAGSGYPTTGLAIDFSSRIYALYEPSWDYMVQKGLDMFLSIPADNARARVLEQQIDHTHALVCKAPMANGIFATAA